MKMRTLILVGIGLRRLAGSSVVVARLALIAWVCVTAALDAGCATDLDLSMRAPDHDFRNARIVFVPAMVSLYWAHGTDGMTFDDELSRRARAMVNTLLPAFAAGVRSRVVGLTEVAGTGLELAEFYSLMDEATEGIFNDWIEHPGEMRPLSAWDLGSRLASWEPALQADCVVFVKFKGLFDTGQQRRAYVRAQLRGGPAVSGRRIAFLSVVDLRSGRIVRLRSATFEDPTSPDEVRSTLNRLGAAFKS